MKCIVRPCFRTSMQRKAAGKPWHGPQENINIFGGQKTIFKLFVVLKGIKQQN